MGRIIALDIGTVRIGVAVTDALGIFAQGVGVLDANSDWVEQLKGHVAHYNATCLLIGLPRRTDGTLGPEAEKIQAIADDLAKEIPSVTIELWDERFTTVIAQQALIAADVSRKKRKGQIDKVAAVLLLQNYLERKGGSHATT